MKNSYARSLQCLSLVLVFACCVPCCGRRGSWTSTIREASTNAAMHIYSAKIERYGYDAGANSLQRALAMNLQRSASKRNC